MSLKDKSAVVTGGSRGLGLGLVEALVAEGAKVTVVARGADALEAVKARLGVATISADVTDRDAANRIIADIQPDILALNAGVTPRMGRLDQLSWEDFSVAWVCERGFTGIEPRHSLSSYCAETDDFGDRNRRCGRRRLRGRDGNHARAVHCPIWCAYAPTGIRRSSSFRSWKTRNTPKASCSVSMAMPV